jgi:hypothetical protein
VNYLLLSTVKTLEINQTYILTFDLLQPLVVLCTLCQSPSDKFTLELTSGICYYLVTKP